MLRRSSRVRTFAWVVAGLLLLYALAGFVVVPALLRSNLESRLSTQLDRPVSVKGVSLNPFVLSLTVGEFEITERDGTPLLGFEELYVNFQLSSIFHRAWTFAEIRLVLPYGVVKIRPDGHVNLADLRSPQEPAEQADATAESTASGRDQPVLPLIVDLLHIDRGILEFHDESRPTPFRADIVPVNFTLKNFKTRQDTESRLALTAEIGPGELVEWHGTMTLRPLASEGQVAATGLRLREVWEYLQDQLRIEITDGEIDVRAAYRMETQDGGVLTSMSGGALSLRNLKLAEKGVPETLIALPALAIDGAQIDVTKQTVTVDSVRTSDAGINGWLDRDGTVNYQNLLAPAPTRHDAAPAAAGTDQPPKEWAVTIKTLSLDNYRISFEDRQPATPVQVRLSPITLRLNNVSTLLDSKAEVDLALKVNETGTIAVTGSAGLHPLSADLGVEVTRLALKPFQPYVDRVARLTVTNGSAALKGQVQYAGTGTGAARLRYNGTGTVAQLAVVDKTLSKDFLKWDSLSINGVSLETAPVRVNIAEVIARKPYARIIIAPDRTVNVSSVLAADTASSPAGPSGSAPKSTTPAAREPTQQTPAPPLPIKIGTVRIINGSTNFADFSMTPAVDTGIQDLNGTIKGLSSKELTRADVSIEGKVDRYAPVRIAGQINPLSSEAYTDLAVSFKNVDLLTLSPYSTRFAGYPIQKGKMSLDLKYTLSKDVLVAENQVVIEQLTLGDKVDSPDATSLPVKLAVALLKDRHGRIDINLPVRGDLNDPEFRYGRILLNVLVNLITKAVTSPFSALASLVGGSGEELREVQFQAGTAELPVKEQKKLTTLANALIDRPALRLEIAGTADLQRDRGRLAEVKLHGELLGLKQGESAPTDRPAGAHDQIDVTDAEYLALLRQAYTQKFGPDAPRTADHARSAGGMSISAVKEELLQTVKVDETELRQLARERGERIHQYLIEREGISADRLFLLDPKVDTVSKGEHVPTALTLSAN